MHRKSVPLPLLHLAIWMDSALAEDLTTRRSTFTQRHKADRSISPDDRASGLARRNGSSAHSRRGNDIGLKAITKATALEVIL